MRIDLYSDSSLFNRHSRQLSRLKNRLATVEEDLEFYRDLTPTGLLATVHVDSVLSATVKQREYVLVLNKEVDSHFELEKLGVLGNSRKYSTLVTVAHCLDYILHRICGADREVVRNIPGYELLSQGLLEANDELLENFDMSIFYGICPKLDSFLVEVYNQTTELLDYEENEYPVVFLREFVRRLVDESESIVLYVSLLLKEELGTEAVVTSKTLSSVVVGTDTDVSRTVTVSSEGHEDLVLEVISFGRKEYLRTIVV